MKQNKKLEVGQIRRRKEGLTLLITKLHPSGNMFSFIVLLKDEYSQCLIVGKEYKNTGSISQWQEYDLLCE